MIIPKTLDEIRQLIADCVEENISLDYKAGDALQNTDGKKKEIAKDISAMANAAGGVIIYGIKEFAEHGKKHLPECVSPVDREVFSKEQLEQIIQSNVSPKIDGLLIHPISVDGSNEAIYVVEIPQGTTAHQNTRDQRYYKRQNFESVPMLDYEIRDIMNRRTHPDIELRFKVVKKKRGYKLTVRPVNVGNQYVNYLNYFVVLASQVLSESEIGYRRKPEEGKVEVYGENTYRDFVDGKFEGMHYRKILGPSRFEPILPGLGGRTLELSMRHAPPFQNDEIEWTVYADNARPKRGSQLLREIEICDGSNDED